MRVIITGGNGFIGTQLIRRALRDGLRVDALVRRPVGCWDERVREHVWRLGYPAPQELGQDLVCAYHLAHDFRTKSEACSTTSGTLRLIEELRVAGVRRQIFVSSLSAGPQSQSRYGRVKTEIELALAPFDDVVVVRPGLVVGGGGLYGRIAYWACRLPVIPLPDGGEGKIDVISVEELCNRLLSLAFQPAPHSPCIVCYPQPLTLRSLVLQAAATRGHRPYILSIPARWLTTALWAAGALGIPLPVSSDNLVGFLANQNTSEHD